MTTPNRPLAANRRLLAPDLARGVMLLLIAMAYASVYVGAEFGADLSGAPVRDRAAGFLSRLFLDNRAFPMFAILFGYGVAWSVRRRRERGVPEKDIRRTLRRRAWFLLLFGAVHAALVYPGEILTSYGLALLVTGWLLFRSDRALWVTLAITGVFYLLTVPALMLAWTLAPEGDGQVVPGYTMAGDWFERIVFLPVNPVYLAIAYPLLFLVALGYLAGRKKLLEEPAAHRGLLRWVAGGGIAVSVLGATPAALLAVGAVEVGPVADGLLRGLQVVTGVAGGAGYAALFAVASGWLGRVRWLPTRSIAAVGKRSLTFYIFNSVLVALVLHPDLTGAGPHVGVFGALVIAAVSWAVGVGAAAWLERRDRQGPLEALMRRGVDGGRPG